MKGRPVVVAMLPLCWLLTLSVAQADAPVASSEPVNRFLTLADSRPESVAKLLLRNDLSERESQSLLGRLSEQHESLELAVEMLEDALDDAPDNALLQQYFGQLSCMLAGHADTGMLSKASYAGDCREALETATTLNPKLLTAWQGLFDFYRMAPAVVGGGIDKAERVIERIAALDPAQAEVARAGLALQQEQYVKMREYFAKAAVLDPSKADQIRLQESLALMRIEDYPSAHAVLKTLPSSGEHAAQVQYQLGRIAVLAAQPAWYNEAEQQLLAYLERSDLNSSHPSKPWAAFRLGQLYELMGKTEQAKARFLWAAAQQPDARLKAELKKKAIKV